MKIAHWVCLLAVVPGVAAAAPKSSPGTRTIERVVALVDGEPIWLSDIRNATVILRRQLKTLPPGKRESARRDMFEQLLDREIERRLIQKEARILGVTVGPEEVEKAVAMVAKQNAIDVPALMASVKKEGLTAASYRAELRYQVLEGKLLMLRMARVGPSSAGEETMKRMEAERARWIKELKRRSRITLRVQP
jgi:peptidyl-prolyl cis-trans isomerase SurA